MKNLFILFGILICSAAEAHGNKTLLSTRVVINDDSLKRAAAPTVEEREAVMKPIKQLLEAIQKGDSAMLHQAFAEHVTFAIFGSDKNSKPFARYESSSDWLLKIVGTPHPEVNNELIWDEKILVNGNFAQVWVNYAFYLGKTFSHCGVNSFHLTKVGDSWKIFHVAFTRQTEGCKSLIVPWNFRV
jgi:hypothetical protein